MLIRILKLRAIVLLVTTKGSNIRSWMEISCKSLRGSSQGQGDAYWLVCVQLASAVVLLIQLVLSLTVIIMFHNSWKKTIDFDLQKKMKSKNATWDHLIGCIPSWNKFHYEKLVPQCQRAWSGCVIFLIKGRTVSKKKGLSRPNINYNLTIMLTFQTNPFRVFFLSKIFPWSSCDQHMANWMTMMTRKSSI